MMSLWYYLINVILGIILLLLMHFMLSIRYLSMVRNASLEDIVVELTNLYDHFFVSYGESKDKVTATRLPCFDGDYWPGAAEDIIYQLRQEEEGRKQNKRGPLKKSITKRALKASGQIDFSGTVSKDLLLMHRVILIFLSLILISIFHLH